MIKSWENCDPFMGGCRDIHKPLTGEPSLVPPEYWEEEELKIICVSKRMMTWNTTIGTLKKTIKNQ